MSLPNVQVLLEAGGTGKVIVDGKELPGVLAVQVLGSVTDLPQVTVTLRPGQVIADLPQSAVTVLRSGPGARDFADRVNPARLEGLALEHLDQHDGTNGEAFAAAVVQLAGEFDQVHRD